MIKIIDPGHKYELLTLDGDLKQELQFVKRFSSNKPKKYPGNYTSYPGTTLQSVIRCLIQRIYYLQNQIPCIENKLIIFMLKYCLWLLEYRAARRHKYNYHHSLTFAYTAPLCKHCGHTICSQFKY